MSETPRPRRATTGPIQYKGEDLEAERGPGLGCFRFQLIVLAIAIVLTPVSVALNWPYEVSAGLLLVTIILLLFAGQTIIFLLRLVAAERRGRRRPLAGRSPTVGELEDASAASADEGDEGASADGGVRAEGSASAEATPPTQPPAANPPEHS